MKCPKCGGKTKIIYSMLFSNGSEKKRKRSCTQCKFIGVTYERWLNGDRIIGDDIFNKPN